MEKGGVKGMQIKVISVGSLKEKYLKQGIEEYTKRLRSYCHLEMIEVPDERAPEKLSLKEMEKIKEKEGKRILSKISDQEVLIAMAIEGKLVSSEDLASFVEECAVFGKSRITFIIGGSLGLSDEVKQRADYLYSFGKITLPHQLMRLVLTEQLYRAFRINAGHSYHK